MPAGTIIDSHEAKLRIARLPLQKPFEAEKELAELLDTVLANPPEPDDLFDLLEYTRTSLNFIRAGAIRHFQEKAPNLETEAEKHFQRGLGMWQRMVKAYTLCAEKMAVCDDNKLHRATVLHRCLYYTAMQIFDHYRVKRQLPPGIWKQANYFYAQAEEDGLARHAVLKENGSDDIRKTYCQALYASLLLVEFAQPFSRDSKELNLLLDWAEQTGPLVRIGRPKVAEQKTAFLVDLDSDQALRPMPGGVIAPTVRALGTSTLIAHLRTMNERFNKTPEQAHLDNENLARARRLLAEMIVTWALAAMPRRYRRRPASGLVKLCSGFHNMHYYILGHEFTQPGAPAESHAVDHKFEEWLVVDQNPCGFRLTREGVGAPLENHQLIAICPHDGEDYLLAQIHWLMQEQSGRLTAGLAALPGIPQAVSIRTEERVKGQRAFYVRAFMLPAIPAMQTDATIILTPGLYHLGAVLEILGQGNVVLKDLVQRGSDFDRVNFTPAQN